MIEIHRKEIAIETDEGEIHLLFSPAQPRGYTALMKAIAQFERMRNEAEELSKGDKALAGAFIIDGEMRSLTEMKKAIRTALLPSEWDKITPIIDYIDISGMLEIAAAILNSYTDHYNHRLKDGLEE